MSDIIQWVIVAIAVIVSAHVVYRRIRRSSKGKCDGCCSKCSKAVKALEECAELKNKDL